jgi:peptidoglycan/xylan/chitin deacetylase (PgdA/CDA1 family)
MNHWNEPCPKHPDQSTAHTCFHCGRKICPLCGKEAGNYIFCSRKCLVLFIFSQSGRLLGRFFRRLWRAIRIAARLLTRKWPRVLWWALVIFILAFEWIIWRGLHRNAQPVTVSTRSAETDTLAERPFVPTRGGMVLKNQIDIEGEADPDRIVSLVADGKPVRVTLPENGRFRFEAVPLNRGENKFEVLAVGMDGRVDLLQSLELKYGAPTLSYLTSDIQRGPLDVKNVSLTFDGGSTDNAAEKILDALKTQGVHSTFFLTGEFIKKYPQIVKRIVAEGHEVGNHTWSHPHLTTFAQNKRQDVRPGVDEAFLKNELIRTASLFRLVTGKEMAKLWRAPYGEYNAEILRWAARAGFRHTAWTVGRGWEENMDTLDWVSDKNSKAYHSGEAIAEKILNYGKDKKTGANGVIILMHLGTERSDDFPHEKLPDIIRGLAKDGYRMVTVSELTVSLH